MSSAQKSQCPGASADPVPDLEPLIGRERMAMDEELVRARELLRDGMTKLHEFFDALRSSVHVQATLLGKLRDESSDSEERAATIRKLVDDSESVLSQSERAILGLQLEDVLGQLLEYTRKRADGLSKIAAALAEAVDRESLAQRDSLHDRLKAAMAEADERANRSVVDQQSLDTGDVELF